MKKLLLPLLFCAILAACDDAEQQYSTVYPCSFTFNTQLHPSSLLTRLYQNSNAFVIVEATDFQGAYRLHLTSNNREEESILLSTDRENNSVRGMGAHNSIIVGCLFTATGTDDPYLYIAYDRQCRYCLDHNASTSFPLNFGEGNLTVSCAKCQRSYSLTTGASNDGQRLYTYRARYNPATQLLSVSNK